MVSSDNVRTQLLITPDSLKSKPLLNKVKSKAVANSFVAIAKRVNTTFNAELSRDNSQVLRKSRQSKMYS